MITKTILGQLIIEALESNSGSASIVKICQYIWQNYESDLRDYGDLFYTWQYDLRWASQRLCKEGIIEKLPQGNMSIWKLC